MKMYTVQYEKFRPVRSLVHNNLCSLDSAGIILAQSMTLVTILTGSNLTAL